MVGRHSKLCNIGFKSISKKRGQAFECQILFFFFFFSPPFSFSLLILFFFSPSGLFFYLPLSSPQRTTNTKQTVTHVRDAQDWIRCRQGRWASRLDLVQTVS
jgi:hypothetical protein